MIAVPKHFVFLSLCPDGSDIRFLFCMDSCKIQEAKEEVSTDLTLTLILILILILILTLHLKSANISIQDPCCDYANSCSAKMWGRMQSKADENQ